MKKIPFGGRRIAFYHDCFITSNGYEMGWLYIYVKFVYVASNEMPIL